MRARWQRLRCKGLLGVWAVFLLMAAMLFAERSGIRTRLQRPGRSYLSGETTLTAAQVMRELPVTCLLVCNSEDASSLDAAEQFPQILTDMTGNHETLMAKNGFYADLYNSQFSEEVA